MAVLLALLLLLPAAPATAATAPATASAHPCSMADAPRIRLLGRARAGVSARFRVTGSTFPLIDWGDGTPAVTRRPRADGTIRHRFAKARRYLVKVTGQKGQCCDVQHTECTTTESKTDRLAVRVHRRRR